MNEELKRAKIVEHFTKPINKKDLTNCDTIEVKSPVCGDQIILMFDNQNNQLLNFYFDGHACAIATSAADLIIQVSKKYNNTQLLRILKQYDQMTKIGKIEENHLLDDLIIFQNINRQKNRVLCATLLSDFLINYLGNQKINQ